jgi:transcriptional repressor NrdR
MRCPFCKLDNDRVLDTRAMNDGYLIRRRRRCGSCQRRFTTYERLEQFNLRVVKRDRSREPFDREKIRSGIERACWKRPVTTDQIEELVQEIEADICAFQESEVASEFIGEILMRRLLKIDQVAHVRFVSVYRDFTDVSDFIREISSLANLEEGPLQK